MPTRLDSGLAACIESHLRSYFDAHEAGLPPEGLYDRILREMETPLLSLTLQICKGNQVRAAEVLGLNRNTLRKKLQDLDLETGRKRKKRPPAKLTPSKSARRTS